MKRLTLLLLLVAVVALAIPVLNLFIATPDNGLSNFSTENDLEHQAVAILATKCVNCHTSDPQLPYYGALPIARGIIEQDQTNGLEAMDYVKILSGQKGADFEVALAKTQYVLEQGTMPPSQYTLLHWNHRLSAADQQTLLSWIAQTRRDHFAKAKLSDDVTGLVVRPIPQEHGQPAAKVALGDKLYHDVRLSGDNSISCASCHDLGKGGTDQSRFSEGVGGQFGDINAPTTFNARYCTHQFWDGRAADLEEQADGPVNNPIEMASNWEQVTSKLLQDPAITAEFLAVYPDGYKKENYVDAIATYERTLITPNSPYDKFLAGDTEALDADQRHGLELWNAYGCYTCHAGEAMGGLTFEPMGRHGDYFGDAPQKPDMGRFNVTEVEADRHKFKTPILRNIALTHPYLHDGSTSDLKEVVQIMATYQVGKDMSDADAALVVRFLEALTGEYNGKPLS